MNNYKTMFLSIFLCLVTCLQADFLYTARDFGTLATDKSEARALNANGWVAGKYFEKEQASDFLWIPETGLQVIAKETDKEIFPKVNNLGLVKGFLMKPGSWLSSDKLQPYSFRLETGLKLGTQSFSRDNGTSVTGMNDTYILYSNHVDVFKSTDNWFIGNNKLTEFKNSRVDKCFPVAINNKSQILVTTESPGIFGSSLLEENILSIYDIATDKHITIAEDVLYYGCGLNDEGLIIARNKKGTEGFFGSKENGMTSLGDFIPKVINNDGIIVGKKGKNVFLRQADGNLIDLNQAVDCKSLGIDEIIDVWALNDKGQILVTVKISGKQHAILLEPRS